MIGLRAFVTCVLVLALPACAARPQVLVADTRSFVGAGREAGDRAAGFFDLARHRQLEANALLVASEPSCRWGNALMLRTDFASGASSLCLSDEEIAAGVEGRRYSLKPIDPRTARPAMELIGALAAYVGELSQLTDPYEPRFGVAVADATGALQDLQATLAASGGPVMPDLTEPAGAIADLLDYFAELALLRGQAAGIEAVVLRDGDRFDAAVAKLADVMAVWKTGVVESADQVADEALLTGVNRTLAQTEDFEARRLLLLQMLDTIETRSAAGIAYDEAATLLDQIASEHAGIRRLLADDPDPAQAARIRKAQADQIMGIISRLAKVGSSVTGRL